MQAGITKLSISNEPIVAIRVRETRLGAQLLFSLRVQ
jgi:hypothetical protein